jgi:RNA polymerase sigma-70 factor (ECF subfamily)
MTGAYERPNGLDVRADAVVQLSPVETFESFYRRELASLVALARSLSGSAYADDIAQEAMLAAYRHWDTVSRLDLPVAWVRRTCANLAVSTLRRRTVEARGLLRLRAQRPPQAGPLPDESDAFWRRVRRLPRRQAQVVALHYVYDLGVAEIATTLGLAVGTVKVHLSRGRSALARELGELAEGDA